MYVSRRSHTCRDLDQSVIMLCEMITQCGHNKWYYAEYVKVIDMTIRSFIQEEKELQITYKNLVLGFDRLWVATSEGSNLSKEEPILKEKVWKTTPLHIQRQDPGELQHTKLEKCY